LYRLNVLRLHLPPLRERREDIVPLAAHFIRTRSASLDRPTNPPGPSNLETLRRYPWPGNVRELASVIERALVLGEDFAFEPEPGECDRVAVATPTPRLDEELVTLAEAETRHIARVLQATGGRIAGPHGAARVLGLHPNTLRSLMVRLKSHQRSAS
jgi:DNA-binding NtrC family response regulator